VTRIRYTLTLGLILSGCQGLPAHADAFPPGVRPPAPGPMERLAPGDPLGWRPAPSPPPIFDRPLDLPRLDPAPWRGSTGAAPLTRWQGTPIGWRPPLTSLGAWRGSGGPPETAGKPPGTENPNYPRPDPDPRPPGPPGPRPDPGDDVPGPLGAGGLAAAWGWARRLRRRIG